MNLGLIRDTVQEFLPRKGVADMSRQPDNKECADMFRVLMHEMMEMHPHYRWIHHQIKELASAVELKAPRKEIVRRVRQLRETMREFDE